MVNLFLLDVRVNGETVDPCKVVLPVELIHGRSSITVQPDAPSASWVYEGSECPYEVGDLLEFWAGTEFEPGHYDSETVMYDDPSVAYDDDGQGNAPYLKRFSGIIAEVRAESRVGSVVSWAIDGVGHLARLGTVPVTLTRPQERDTARVQAIGAAAGASVHVVGNQGPLLAAGEVKGDALSVLHDVCVSAGGLLWQALDGTITYGTQSHRPIDAKPRGLIPCDALDSEIAWTQTVDEIVNEVSITWGPSNSQQTTTRRDNSSIAMPWGLRHADITTTCANEADADNYALLVLGRRAFPFWHRTDGIVSVDLLDPSEARMMQALDVSDPVYVPIPVNPGATPSDPFPVVVEGFTQTWTAGGEIIAQVALSDQKRWVTSRARKYSEVTAGGTYKHWLETVDSYVDLYYYPGA